MIRCARTTGAGTGWKAFRQIAQHLRGIADEVGSAGTQNGHRPLEARWAEGAIKRLMSLRMSRRSGPAGKSARWHQQRSHSATRDQAGAHEHLPKAQRPTFHDVRALGMRLYTEAAFTKEYAIALSGRATEPMFERFTLDHETKSPARWWQGLNWTSGKCPEFPRKLTTKS